MIAAAAAVATAVGSIGTNDGHPLQAQQTAPSPAATTAGITTTVPASVEVGLTTPSDTFGSSIPTPSQAPPPPWAVPATTAFGQLAAEEHAWMQRIEMEFTNLKRENKELKQQVDAYPIP